MKEKFRRKVLENGMTILFEKRDVPVVSVAIGVRYGSINEELSEKGLAHFIEHMLYKGTEKRNTQKISNDIERNGGELNAFTTEVATAYHCRMPSRHLDVALDVLSDIVKNPLFDGKELEKERNVIFEEIKMYKDNPRLHAVDEIQKLLYDGSLSVNIIGTYETMNSIDRKKMVKKFEKVYKPNNLILCVVGDADFDKLVDFAEKNFKDKKVGKIPEQTFGKINKSKIEEREGVDQANLIFAYHIPNSTEKKSYAARVLSTLMAGGMSSRLFHEIREKRNLAYAVKGDSAIYKKFAYSLIYVGTTKDKVDKVKEIILKEFEDVSKNLTEKELNEVKEQIIGKYQISMEDSQDQMVNLLMSEIDGNAYDFYDFEEKIKNVNLDEVKEIANIKNHSFFALVPKQ